MSPNVAECRRVSSRVGGHWGRYWGSLSFRGRSSRCSAYSIRGSDHLRYGLIRRLLLAEPVCSVHTHFDAIQRDQQETDTPESVRNYAKQQFEKRLNRIAKARGQSVEQIEEIVLSEDSAETAAP
jgi:hypothetical protein